MGKRRNNLPAWFYFIECLEYYNVYVVITQMTKYNSKRSYVVNWSIDEKKGCWIKVQMDVFPLIAPNSWLTCFSETIKTKQCLINSHIPVRCWFMRFWKAKALENLWFILDISKWNELRTMYGNYDINYSTSESYHK